MTKIIINDKYDDHKYNSPVYLDPLSKISNKGTIVVRTSIIGNTTNKTGGVEIYDIKNLKRISKVFQNYESAYEQYGLYVFSNEEENLKLKYNSTGLKQVFNNSGLQILKDFNDEDDLGGKHRFGSTGFEKDIYTVTTKSLGNGKYQHNLSVFSYETGENIGNIILEDKYVRVDLISFSKAGYFELGFNASYGVGFELALRVDSNGRDQVSISSILNNGFLVEFLGETEYSIKNPFTGESFGKYREVGDFSEGKCIVEKLKIIDNNVLESNYVVIDEHGEELFKLPKGIRSANNFKYKNGYLILNNQVFDSEGHIVMTIDDDQPESKKSVKFNIGGHLVIERNDGGGEWYETLHTISGNDVSDDVEWFSDSDEGLRSLNDNIIFVKKIPGGGILLKKFSKKDFFPEVEILGSNSIKINDSLFRTEKTTSNIELLSNYGKLTEMTDLGNSVEINGKKFKKNLLKI